MFAVIKTGGKQYKVAEGSIIEVEKLEGDEGASVSFDEVLMLGGDKPEIGTPFLAGKSVSGEIIEQKRGPKLVKLIKRRRKHSSQRRRGHRQYLSVVKITSLEGKAPAKKAEAKKAEAKPAPKKDAKGEAKGEAKPASEKSAKSAKTKAAKAEK